MQPIRHVLRLPHGDDLPDSRAPVLPVADAMPVKGDTIASALARSGIDFMGLPTVCCVMRAKRGGQVSTRYVLRAGWATTKIARNDNVLFISRPQGGQGGGNQNTGKMIGAAVAMIALAVLAPYAVAAIGLTGLAASIASTALIAGGGMLISHFLKPKTSGKSETKQEIYSLAFQGNQAKPLQTVPVGYGRRLQYPDEAAPAYSEYDGQDQISYMLFCLGAGKYDLEEIRISDTPIWTKGGGVVSGFGDIAVEIIPPSGTVTLFPTNIVSSTEISGVKLTNSFTPAYAVNAANTLADQIILDLIWESGCYYTFKGSVFGWTSQIVVEAQAINAAGAPTGGWETILNKTYSYTSQSPIRVTERINVAPGRYQIRVTQQGNIFTSNGANQVTWAAMRAHVQGPTAVDGVTRLAIRARSSASLSGFNNGRINTIQTRILPVWNGSQFVEAPTRSIAWAALDVWTNAQYCAGLPLARVDVARFAELDALWNGLGHTFDHFFTAPTSVMNALETILKAGRAYPNVMGDTLSITRDQARAAPRQLFTDNEIVKGSLKRSSRFFDQQLADGVVGSYLDETTWRLADVTSAGDGVTLAKPTRIEIIGVVNRAQAAGLVRFHAAESLYRRQTWTFQTEMEGLLVRRGDLIKVSTELPQTWGSTGSAVLISASLRKIALSPAPAWANSGNHFLEIKAPDGTLWGPVKVARAGTDSEALMDINDVAAAEGASGYTMEQVLDRPGTQEPASYVFGQAQPRSASLLVTGGQPNGDHHITLTAVNDNTAVYDVVETGVPILPVYPTFLGEQPPVIIIQSAFAQQQGLTAVLNASWLPDPNAGTYVAEYALNGDGNWQPIALGNGGSATFLKVALPVPTSATVSLRVAGVTRSGVPGAWTVRNAIVVPIVMIDSTKAWLHISYEDLVGGIKGRMDQFPGVYRALADTLEGMVTGYEGKKLAETGIREISRVENTLTSSLAQKEVEIYAAFGAADAALTQTQLALADEQQALAGELVTANAAIDANEAAITAETAARATEDEALAQSIASLSATTTASLATVDSALIALATADEATAGQIISLNASIGAVSASVISESVARTNADAALSQRIDAFEVTYGGFSAQVLSSFQAQATQNAAFAQQISSVTAIANGMSANGDVRLQALAGPGGVIARYGIQLKANQNGQFYNAGFYVELVPDGYGGLKSQVFVDASNFIIGDPNTRDIPFAVVNGITYIKEAVIRKGGISNTAAAVGNSRADVSMVLPADTTVSIFAAYQGGEDGVNGSGGSMSLFVNGAGIASKPIPTIFVAVNAGAGVTYYLSTTPMFLFHATAAQQYDFTVTLPIVSTTSGAKQLQGITLLALALSK